MFFQKKYPFEPIIELFLIRNHPKYDFPCINKLWSEHFFFDLPQTTNKQLSLFVKTLELTNSIHDALRSIQFSYKYSASILKIFKNKYEAKCKFSNIETFILLFQCLGWFYLDENDRDNKDLIDFLKIFGAVLNGCFDKNISFIYKELITLSISKKDDVFILAIDPINEFILNIQKLETKYISTILKYLSRFDQIDKYENFKQRSIEFMKSLVIKKSTFLRENKRFLGTFVSLISKEISELNQSALFVFFKCSDFNKNSTLISEIAINILLNLFYKSKSCLITDVDMFLKIPQLDKDNVIKQEQNSKLLQMPDPNIIESKIKIFELCQPYFQEFLPTFIESLNNASDNCIETMFIALSTCFKDFLKMKNVIDFIVIIVIILQNIGRKISYNNLMNILVNEVTFNPCCNIFNNIGLQPQVNTIRNGIIDLIVNNNRKTIKKLFVMLSGDPILYSELVTRIIYRNPLPNSFFVSKKILPTMMGSTLSIVQLSSSKFIININLARSVLLNVLFNILEDQETNSKCFESNTFTTGLLSLIFESEYTSSINHALFKYLSTSSTIPESVILLLRSIFLNCRQQQKNKDLSSVANEMVNTIATSISHNNLIASSFELVIDSALEYLQSNHSLEIFEKILLIITLVFQNDFHFEITTKRFNLLLDLIYLIEGNEVLDSTFIKLQNLLGNSTNLSKDFLFKIQNPDFIPIILISYSKSKKLFKVIDFFYNLCKYSPKNIDACNKGEIVYILLNSLKGEFNYNRRKVEFYLNSDIIENHILKLFSIILPKRSNYSVDNAFMEFIKPNEKCEYNKYASLIMETLKSLLVQSDNTFSSIYYIFHTDNNYLTYKGNLPLDNLNDSFIFMTYLKVDQGRTRTINNKFYFLQIEDKDSIFNLFLHQNCIYANYKNQSLSAMSSITKEFPSNEWFLFSLFYGCDSNGYFLTYKINNKLYDDGCDFPQINFKSPVNLRFAFSDTIFPTDDDSPVCMGPFCLIDKNTNEIIHEFTTNDFEEIDTLLSYKSKEIIQNNGLIRKDINIKESFITHTQIEEFLPIFANLENAPLNYASSTLYIIEHGVDFSKIIFSSYYTKNLDLSLVNELLNIDISKFKIQNIKIEKKLSSFSIIFYYLLFKVQHSKVDYNLFLSFVSLQENITHNKKLQQEIFDNFVLNLFFWFPSGEKVIKKVIKYWKLLLSRKLVNFNNKCFKRILVQSYILQKYSSNYSSKINSYVFAFLNKFSIEIKSEKIIQLIIFMCLSFQNNKIEIINYLNVLLNIAQSNTFLMQSESIDFLMQLVNNKDPEIVNLIFNIFSSTNDFLSRKRITKLFILLGNQINFQIKNANLDALCMISLFYGIDNNKIILEMIEQVKDNSKLWYFWPILLSLIYPIFQEKVIEFLLKFPENYKNVIIFMHLLNSLELFDIRKLRNLYVQKLTNIILSMSSDQVNEYVEILFMLIYYKFTNINYSKDLLKLIFDNSDIIDISCLPKVEKINYEKNNFNLPSFIKIFTFKFSNYRLIYSPSKSKVLRKCLKSVLNESFSPKLKNIKEYIDNENSDKLYSTSISYSLFNDFESKYKKVLNNFFIDEILCISSIFDIKFNKNYSIQVINKALSKEIIYFITLINYGIEKSQLYLKKNNIENMFSYNLECKLIKFIYKHHKLFLPRYDMPSDSFINLNKIKKSSNIAIRTYNCTLITIFKKEPCIVDMYDSMIIFHSDSYQLFKLYLDSILFVNVQKKNKIEFFSYGYFSILIEIDENDKLDFIKNGNKINLPFIENIGKLYTSLKNQWASRKITNLDFLLSLNLIFGRSFNDINNFPICPYIKKSEIIFNYNDQDSYKEKILEMFDKKLDLEIFIEDLSKTGFLPFEIFFSNIFNNENSKIIHEYKQMIESDFVKNSLSKWIDINFNMVNQNNQIQFIQQPQNILNSTSDILIKSNYQSKDNLFGLFGYLKNIIYYFDKNTNKLCFSKINWDNFSLENIQAPDIPYSKTILIDSKNSYFVFFDKSYCASFKMTSLYHTYKYYSLLNITSLKIIGENIILVIDNHYIEICSISTYPLKRRTIYSEPQKITKLEISDIFGIIAFCTNFGKIKILSLIDGTLFGEYDFMSTITNILLTKEQCNLFVECESTISILSIHCQIIKSFNILRPILRWNCFTMCGIKEYINFIDIENNYFIFESKNPENKQFLLTMNENVVYLDYVHHLESTIMITDNGNIYLHHL